MLLERAFTEVSNNSAMNSRIMLPIGALVAMLVKAYELLNLKFVKRVSDLSKGKINQS